MYLALAHSGRRLQQMMMYYVDGHGRIRCTVQWAHQIGCDCVKRILILNDKSNWRRATNEWNDSIPKPNNMSWIFGNVMQWMLLRPFLWCCCELICFVSCTHTRHTSTTSGSRIRSTTQHFTSNSKKSADTCTDQLLTNSSNVNYICSIHRSIGMELSSSFEAKNAM